MYHSLATIADVSSPRAKCPRDRASHTSGNMPTWTQDTKPQRFGTDGGYVLLKTQHTCINTCHISSRLRTTQTNTCSTQLRMCLVAYANKSCLVVQGHSVRYTAVPKASTQGTGVLCMTFSKASWCKAQRPGRALCTMQTQPNINYKTPSPSPIIIP